MKVKTSRENIHHDVVGEESNASAGVGKGMIEQGNGSTIQISIYYYYYYYRTTSDINTNDENNDERDRAIALQLPSR